MRANPFVVLVSTAEDGPFASHVPVKIRETGDQLIIRGHFAKANPHWRLPRRDVAVSHDFPRPTLLHFAEFVHQPRERSHVELWSGARLWKCAPVHFTRGLAGCAERIDGPLQPPYAEQWAGLDETYRQRMLTHIVGFEITATRIEAKFKLGQNRTREEQSNMIASLGKAEDTAVSGVARLMQEQGLGVKKQPE